MPSSGSWSVSASRSWHCKRPCPVSGAPNLNDRTQGERGVQNLSKYSFFSPKHQNSLLLHNLQLNDRNAQYWFNKPMQHDWLGIQAPTGTRWSLNSSQPSSFYLSWLTLFISFFLPFFLSVVNYSLCTAKCTVLVAETTTPLTTSESRGRIRMVRSNGCAFVLLT